MTAPIAGKPWLAPKTAPREIIARDPSRSFNCLQHDFPSAICGWANHPEYEIHLITKSHGSVIAGDHVGTFGPGHLSMMGPMLPHDWVSDVSPGEVVAGRDSLVHFTDEWIRDCMQLMPELGQLDALLTRSTRGVEFTGQTAKIGAQALSRVIETSGPTRIAQMFHLLDILASAPSTECRSLASEWLGSGHDETANEAAEAGLAYIFDNLTSEISLSTAASLAHMSDSTFSKYFKRGAGMTFSQMVKRLRVSHACRLLDSTRLSASAVAEASGFRNLSNFNRQFLAEVGVTPTAYRKVDPEHGTPPASGSGHR